MYRGNEWVSNINLIPLLISLWSQINEDRSGLYWQLHKVVNGGGEGVVVDVVDVVVVVKRVDNGVAGVDEDVGGVQVENC